MHCVSTQNKSCLLFIFHGEMTEPFLPSRGLRHGDPLSPYLFFLCLEKLSHWIYTAMEMNKWKPIKVSRGGPSISHIFFADDLVFFWEATCDQAENLMECLEAVSSWSGQKMNASTGYFSQKMFQPRSIRNISQIPITKNELLGVPVIHQRGLLKMYSKYFLERKLKGLKCNPLSLAGRASFPFSSTGVSGPRAGTGKK